VLPTLIGNGPRACGCSCCPRAAGGRAPCGPHGPLAGSIGANQDQLATRSDPVRDGRPDTVTALGGPPGRRCFPG
jgi:hypothetical protein